MFGLVVAGAPAWGFIGSLAASAVGAVTSTGMGGSTESSGFVLTDRLGPAPDPSALTSARLGSSSRSFASFFASGKG